MKKAKLFLSALTKFLCGLILLDVMLFLPAGTFSYMGSLRRT